MRRMLTSAALAALAVATVPGGPAFAAPIQLIPLLQYRPGLYDTGPVAVQVDTDHLRNLVCARSMGGAVSVTGQLMYSTDGGQSWQDWSPFGMNLGEATWDTKRNRLMSNTDSCSGAAAVTTGWTHVRLFVEIAGGDAMLSAVLADVSNSDAASASGTALPGWLPDGRQTLLDSGN